jgi:hypothetical protein
MMSHPAPYILFWATCLLLAARLLLRKPQIRKRFSDYRAFLSQPWKIATFIIAASGITLAAPYSGDPTWDYPDSIIISALTFMTAPWAVGAVFRSLKTRTGWADIFVAVCMMLFSSSWFYDIYISLRDGVYPATWLSNLLISPSFYILGGLFWNLEHQPGRGIIFSFQRDAWYHEAAHTSFRKVVWIAMPLMAFAVYGVAWFVLTEYWN